jgi:hypothetical protein
MRQLRVVSFAGVILMMTTASAFAATYSWPLATSQPVTVSNLTYSATSQLEVVCGVATTPGGAPITEGTTTVPVTPANGVVSYSGSVMVQIGSSSQAGAPQAGNTVSCNLREKTGSTWANVGSASTLRLP